MLKFIRIWTKAAHTIGKRGLTCVLPDGGKAFFMEDRKENSR